MFVILLHYENGLDPVHKALDAHRAWLAGNYEAGRFLVSGPCTPRTGGVILCRAKDREELEALVRTDPFVIQGAARCEIVEFEPTQWSSALEPVFGKAGVGD